MEIKLLHALVAYGFTENEAKIYLALLRKMEASAFEIAKTTNIPRTTVYLTLEKMKRTQLVSSIKKNNVLHYTPEKISNLRAILLEKQQALEAILPQLNALIDTDKEKPNTRMYLGAEGRKIVLNDIIETMEYEKLQTLYAASHTKLMEDFPKYFPNWLKRREALGVRTKLILPENERSDHVFKSNELRETKFLPDKFPFEATIEIYGKNIAIFFSKNGEMYSIIIESRQAAEIFKQFFLFAWNHANS